MRRTHTYDVTVTWTGNRGAGTTGYPDYGREHEITADGPPAIPASSDAVFHGDQGRWNPEQQLTAALSACHMLWYLHLCSVAGVVVTAYADDAHGVMEEAAEGGGRFTEITLRPCVVVASADMTGKAASLHVEAAAKCYIANSVNFPVRHEPTVTVVAEEAGGMTVRRPTGGQ